VLATSHGLDVDRQIPGVKRLQKKSINLDSAPRVSVSVENKAGCPPSRKCLTWTVSCFPSRGQFRGDQLKGESESSAQQSSNGNRPKLNEKGLLTPNNCVVALIDH
jgi:hypothetical protein